MLVHRVEPTDVALTDVELTDVAPTADAIAQTLIRLVLTTAAVTTNWGTGSWPSGCNPWDVTTTVYINGVVMTLDFDYHTGHLVEVVNRDTAAVSWLAVVLFNGPDATTNEQDYVARWFPTNEAPTFFDRGVTTEEVAAWALHAIFDMLAAAPDS